MRMLQVVRDDSMAVPGYEQQTLECESCHEREQRRVFRSEPAQSTEVTSPESGLVEPVDAISDRDAVGSPFDAPTQPQMPISISSTPLPEADDDAQEMLRRAIEMVRGPRAGAPLRGLTDREPAMPSDPDADMREREFSRVVQVRHDPTYEAAYAAKDMRTGLVVLRHKDILRLRAMCDRLGWQVVEDATPEPDL
jgi:hypothetical protein